MRAVNSFPATIKYTDFIYWGTKAFVEMCELEVSTKEYLPEFDKCCVIAGYDNEHLISFILYEVNYEEKIIEIVSAYTLPEYRRQGYYVELFNILKAGRKDTILELFTICSNVCTNNLPVMQKILEQTGRTEISRNFVC